MTVSKTFVDQGNRFIEVSKRYDAVQDILKELDQDYTVSDEPNVAASQPEPISLTFPGPDPVSHIPVRWLLPLLAFSDTVAKASEYRQQLHNHVSLPGVLPETVVWVGPNINDDRQTVRLEELSDQLWAAVMLVLYIECEEGRPFLPALGSNTISLIMAIYNAALRGVSADWILDDEVEVRVIESEEH